MPRHYIDRRTNPRSCITVRVSRYSYRAILRLLSAQWGN